MARTQVVIGYSFVQAVRRTTVIPDDDSQVAGYVAWVKNMGEGTLVGSWSDYLTIGPDAMLARYLGRGPMSARCALVNASGVVIAHLGADPLLDRSPLGRFHADPHGKSVIGRLVNIPSY